LVLASGDFLRDALLLFLKEREREREIQHKHGLTQHIGFLFFLFDRARYPSFPSRKTEGHTQKKNRETKKQKNRAYIQTFRRDIHDRREAKTYLGRKAGKR
jgi:hypothetical protein